MNNDFQSYDPPRESSVVGINSGWTAVQFVTSKVHYHLIYYIVCMLSDFHAFIIYLRNEFHFSDVHGAMNRSGSHLK